MVVEQIPFEIPADILSKLLDGTLNLTAAVVRDSTGQIVAHLDKAIPKKEAGHALAKVMQLAKQNPVLAIGGTVAVASAVGLGIHFAAKNREQQNQAARYKERLNTTVVDYVDAIQRQTMSIDLVDNLLSAINDLEGNTSLRADTIIGAKLKAVILDYITEFLAANSVVSFPGEAEIINIHERLEKQRATMEQAS